jgi:LuxR family maltose regulon positive regulatory protein
VAPGLIDRADLIAVLDQAATRRVTVISAPAGSGKTSLLRAWADRPGRRLAVLQVRRDQQDAQQFWLALLEAVGCTQPATPDFNDSAMVDRVLSELADGIMLVVDDLHELTSPTALAQLTRLLTSLPPQAHAILTTRHDLRLGLHRLRLAGELAEIRAADLRFTERETRELLAASGVTLSEAGTKLLHQRTEGWAAGLGLAALSLAGHPDPGRFVAEFSGSNRAVADYLLAEMLDRRSAGVQDLLLRTSVLDRVNGELADLLTGRVGSERVLLELSDANAFVVSLDAERTWFRYQHLFADLLKQELRRRLAAEIPALNRRAAGWFVRRGQPAEAIRHMQAAGDWADAARLLADRSFGLTLDGQTQTMQALVRAFPPGEEHPELALVRASAALAEGRLTEAVAQLAAAEAYAESAPNNRRHRLRVAISALKLSLARRRGDLADVVEHVRFLAAPVTGRSVEDIALSSDLRAVALMSLGAVEAWSLGAPEAEGHLEEGAALANEIGRPYLEVACRAQLAVASKIHSLATTQRRCREAIALAEQYGWGAEPVIAPALVTLAATMIWLGAFDEGEEWLRRTTRALQTDSGPDIRLLLHQTTGMLHAGRGRLAEALAEFTETERLASQLAGAQALAGQATGWLLATQARLGRPDLARAALAGIDRKRADSGEIRNARAVICLAEHDPAGALHVLQSEAPVIGYVTVVEAELLAGLAHRELGDHSAADRAVARALDLAEPDRLVLPFAMTGTRELLPATDIVESPTTQNVPPPTEELSPGELRVLRYLPTNLSRPEIAIALSLSVNTVRTHLRSIYGKLQVSDRFSAVQRARELQLLTNPR